MYIRSAAKNYAIKVAPTATQQERAEWLAPYIYRCIHLRAASAATVGFLRDGAGAEDRITADMVYRCAASLAVAGGVFLLRRELRALNPATMRVLASAERGIEGYEQRVGGVTQRYALADIAYRHYWHPTSDVHGLAPLEVARESARIAISSEQFAASFFSGGAVPPLLISPEQGILTSQDQEAFRNEWQRLIAGVRNAWRALVMPRSVQVRELSMPALDKLALEKLDEITIRRIAAAFGVPTTMISEASNYATAREHLRSFWATTVVPDLDLLAELFSEALGYEVSPNYADIDILAEDSEAKAKQIIALYQAGIMSLEEARTAIGMEGAPQRTAMMSVREWTDEVRAWREKTRKRGERVAEWRSERIPAHVEHAIKALAARVERPFSWLAYYEAKARHEPPPVEKAEEELARVVLRVLRALKDKLAGEEANLRGALDEAESAMRDEMVGMLLEVALDSAVANEVGYGYVDVDELYDYAADWARAHAREIAHTITDTTRGKIERAIQDATARGLTLGQVMGELEPVFGATRAEMIATTEITRAYSAGVQAAREDLRRDGVETHLVWRTRADEMVCAICGPRNGKRQGSGWTDLPPAHPRCRCWVTIEV